MDRFLAPETPEALAHHHLTENWFSWDTEHPSLDETLIAGCASYQAFNRFLSGDDLYLLPRSRHELESVLRSYGYDAVHNAIAKARSMLERGGYSRICQLMEASIRKVLDANDNASYLLELHRPQFEPVPTTSMNSMSHTRFIKIK
ncbi:hypothetical protein NLI96_g679 [Meripilus lineatus]|uniref:Uncharacterized protein n=1 Tax=Meripilus lineatus TaxID=2056292 RepID=A0AAD5YLR6_9APHY|nr:hypothetical protein NLI96_g679 [Physisporinus lineatus]